MIDQSWYKKPPHAKEREAAGGIIIRKEEDKLFVALMYDIKYPFDYELPKGGIEVGEQTEIAARREIIEEIGLSELQMVSFIGKQERLSFSKRTWVTIHYYLFTTTQKEGRPTDHTKTFHLEWFALDQLPDMLWPEQKKLLEESREKIKQLVN